MNVLSFSAGIDFGRQNVVSPNVNMQTFLSLLTSCLTSNIIHIYTFTNFMFNIQYYLYKLYKYNTFIKFKVV